MAKGPKNDNKSREVGKKGLIFIGNFQKQSAKFLMLRKKVDAIFLMVDPINIRCNFFVHRGQHMSLGGRPE